MYPSQQSMPEDLANERALPVSDQPNHNSTPGLSEAELCKTKNSTTGNKKFSRATWWLKRGAFGLFTICLLSSLAFAVCWWLFPFPIDKLHDFPYGQSLTDSAGQVIYRSRSIEDQWVEPIPLEQMGDWLGKATIAVEDESFREHPGVDSLAVLRAIGQNLSSGRVVSGASTLSMQVCKMLGDRPRSFKAKCIEAFQALQMEQLLSKDEILENYLNIAPYGSNIRGVAMASRFYFNKDCDQLSLAEAALIAGLPQSPNRYRPDMHFAKAKKRQLWVLWRMYQSEMISYEQYKESSKQKLRLSKSVSLGQKLACRNEYNFHYSQAAMARKSFTAKHLEELPGPTQLCLDSALQKRVFLLASKYIEDLPEHTELSIVIIDVKSGELRAMLGSIDSHDPEQGQVNGALAWRSPGSSLKPFIYALAFDKLHISPKHCLPDKAVDWGSWQPNNFLRQFSGEVQASDALIRSLNVPAILLSEKLGIQSCMELMKEFGLRWQSQDQASKSLSKKVGLSLAVGGLECRLIDLTNAYATLARGGQYKPYYLFKDNAQKAAVNTPTRLRSKTCYLVNTLLSKQYRDHDDPSQFYGDYMWKTGTSSARRDAIAVGHNGKFAVGIWVGRFDAKGHKAYTGQSSAQPLLRKIMELPELQHAIGEGSNWKLSPEQIDSWPVRRPFRFKKAKQTIIHPKNGAVLISAGAHLNVHCQSSSKQPGIWRVNGLTSKGQDARFELSIGSYELQFIDFKGKSSSSRFKIVAPTN